MITGTSVSTTVIVKVQVPVKPAASVTVQVTVVTPFGKVVPLAGEQATGLGGKGQLSLMMGAA